MNRFKNLLLLSAFHSIIAVSFGQSDSEIIKTIRKEYVRINGLSSLQKVILNGGDFLENTPDGGAELTGYFKKDSSMIFWNMINLCY